MANNLRDVQNFLLVGSDVLYQNEGNTGYDNIGSIQNISASPETNIIPVKESYRNKLITKRKQSIEYTVDLQIKGNEFWKRNYKYIFQSQEPSSVNQPVLAAPGVTMTIADTTTPKLGKSFTIIHSGDSEHKMHLDTVVVQSGPPASLVARTEGIDYNIDYGAGMIYVIDGGAIVDNHEISVTAGCAEIDYSEMDFGQDLNFYGDILINLYDHRTYDPLSANNSVVGRIASKVSMNSKEFPVFNLEEQSSFMLNVTLDNSTAKVRMIK